MNTICLFLTLRDTNIYNHQMTKFIYGSKCMFGILYIFTSKRNIFIHITDITGKETLSRISAGVVSKSKKQKNTNYSAMVASQLIASKCKVMIIKTIEYWNKCFTY